MEKKTKPKLSEEQLTKLKDQLHTILDNQGMEVGPRRYSFEHSMKFQGQVDEIIDRWFQ